MRILGLPYRFVHALRFCRRLRLNSSVTTATQKQSVWHDKAMKSTYDKCLAHGAGGAAPAAGGDKKADGADDAKDDEEGGW